VDKLLVIINCKAVGIITAEQIALFNGIEHVCFAFAEYATHDHMLNIYDPITDHLYSELVFSNK